MASMNILRVVAGNIYDSDLMKRYVEEITKKDREKWQLSEVDKSMMTGGDKACAYIEKKADSHLSRLVSRMEWFPVKYHLVDKVALVVFTVLGYYTGKYHLNDDLVFLCFGADVYLNRSFNVTTFWNMRLY